MVTSTPSRGSYLLLATLDSPHRLSIGKLGVFDLPRGWYAYVGSALGPGGLPARLSRHRRRDKRMHWHIDYVLSAASLDAVWQIASAIRLECAWASALRALPGAVLIVPGFGSSDCRCAAHLVYWLHRPTDDCIHRALLRAAEAWGIPDAGSRLSATRYACPGQRSMEG